MSQIIPFPLQRPETRQAYREAHHALRARLEAEGRTRAEISRQSQELLATFEREKRRRAMAALDGRPVQTKAEQAAEWRQRKAERKADTNEVTKQKIKRVAQGVTPVTDADIDRWVKQAVASGYDADKVRAHCEDIRGRCRAGVDAFIKMLSDDFKKEGWKYR